MPKRFTETNIWDKEWFMELSCKHKCLIKYLFDKCDHAGIWTPNWKLATVHVGEKVSMVDMEFIPKTQFKVLTGGKIYLLDFITFQYGSLSEKSPAHNPVFYSLNKHGLLEGYLKGIHTLQDKDKEKDKEEVKDKDKGESQKPKEEKSKTFKDLNQDQFYAAISTYKHDFDKKLLREFYDYWREPTTSGKMRFQLERTWDLQLRLERWQKNNFNKTEKGETIDENGKPKLSAREENDAEIINSVN